MQRKYIYETSQEALARVQSFAKNPNLPAYSKDSDGHIKGLRLNKNVVVIDDVILSTYWETHQQSLQISDSTHIKTNLSHSAASLSTSNKLNQISSASPATHAYSTREEASLRVVAFSEMVSEFPRDDQGFLLNLQLKNKTVTISDDALNTVWIRNQAIISQTLLSDSTQQNSIATQVAPQSSYQIPSTLFASQVTQSTRVNHPFVHAYASPQEALARVKAFSEATNHFPKDYQGFLQDLKLKQEKVLISEATLNYAWISFMSKQDALLLTPQYRPTT